MQYIELHHQSQSTHCDFCGTLNHTNLTAQFIDNGEITQELSFQHNPHFSGNWSGQMIDVYLSLINKIGYSIQFSGQLELYSDAFDFNPNDDFNFYSSEDEHTKPIPVLVTYERDFFQVTHNKFDFKDIPKKFEFELNDTNHCIQTNSFEIFYKFFLSKITNISEFKHHEHEEFLEKHLEY